MDKGGRASLSQETAEPKEKILDTELLKECRYRQFFQILYVKFAQGRTS
ncbi:hypothetical protein MASR2M79_15720 [Aminivibrio sp.]